MEIDIKQLDQSHVMGTYNRQDILIHHGKNATCYDETGNAYIDFGSGIGVNSLGYCDPAWIAAVTSQAAALQHASNLYYTEPAVRLAALLSQVTGYEKVFFGNSGAEANECAIKIARKYSFDKYGKDANRNKILSLNNSFHGRTVTTLSATGQDVFHNYFFPFTEGFSFAPADSIDQVKEILLSGGYCGVILEFVQGEGGVNPLEQAFVQELFAFCEEQDILTIADEVQTGVGRTGKFLASEHFGVKPNLTTLAKGLGGGLPIGACLGDEKTGKVLKYSDHGTTYGGNPVVCAGALTAVSRIAQEDFLTEVLRKGEMIRTALSGLEEVLGVDGLGLMLGIRLKTKKSADMVKACIPQGLILLTAKEKVRLLPPLTITDEELQKGLSILINQLKAKEEAI